MAKIVTITNPITGQPAQVDQLDHTAQQIDDGLNIARGVSNPNLLDNWYFANPVNQRGQTSYTGEGYGIDRYRAYADGTILITDQGIQLIGLCYWGQPFIAKSKGFLPGRKFTFSALVDKPGAVFHLWSTSLGGFLITEGSYDNGLVTITFTVPSGVLPNDEIRITANNSAGANPAFCGMKLELGSQQTLAHKGENGNWVLNEIPDYGEQLARCQRYHFEFGPSHALIAYDGYGVNSPVVYFPVQMRTVSAIKVYSKAGTENAITYWNGSAEVDFTDFILEWNENFVVLRSNGKFTQGGIYTVGKLIAYADL